MADGVGVGVAVEVGVEVPDPMAGLGLTRLREPMARIKRRNGNIYAGYGRCICQYFKGAVLRSLFVLVVVVVALSMRCVRCSRWRGGRGRSWGPSWLALAGFPELCLYVILVSALYQVPAHSEAEHCCTVCTRWPARKLWTRLLPVFLRNIMC